MRTLLCFAVTVLASLGASADDKKDMIDTKKLVGKWEPKEKSKGGSGVVEFTKDGKVRVTITVEGKESKSEGRYEADGNKLSLTYKAGGEEQTHTLTVSKLTDTELVIARGTRKEETYVRLKDE